MAHKIGLNDAQYEPGISGEVDFSFFDSSSEVERTKGSGMVSEARTAGSVIGAASPSPASLLHSRYRRVEDTSSSRRQTSKRRGTEGQQASQEVVRDERETCGGSSEVSGKRGGSASSLEAQQPSQAGAVMEHVDPIPYSSDEWEESDVSDTEGDHSDSSDDDDPKSQVDKLIERGTLMYMEGENSNLSSETDSTDSSDYDDSDSESDITDVSPLISATASPLGLSPVLPRRALGTSPLALHDNRDLLGFTHRGDHPGLDHRDDSPSHDQGYETQQHCNGYSHSNSDDSTDMTLLLKAVVELEKKQKQLNSRGNGHRYQNRYQNRYMAQPTSSITIHPIDASPHHKHLLRNTNTHQRRKNMSFSNEEVRRIDRENQLLLQKIMSAHNRSRNHNSNHTTRPVHRPANSTVSRKREEDKIRRDNMILLRKIQEAKPSRDVTASRP